MNYHALRGVSAGIDVALALSAELSDQITVQAIQPGIEYNPTPAFPCIGDNPRFKQRAFELMSSNTQ